VFGINIKAEVERVILESFVQQPFHTLYFKHGIIPHTDRYGGTCSDKVLSSYQKLRLMGVQVRLHSSLINGKETHRVLKIQLGESIYFADVGNGWPSIRLFPASYDYTYSCFGITFESMVFDEKIEIYHDGNVSRKLAVTIPLESKCEKEILCDISKRFNPDIDYPFREKVRFAQVVKDKFYFLRSDQLYFYQKNGRYVEDINMIPLEQVLGRYFDFNITYFLQECRRQ